MKRILIALLFAVAHLASSAVHALDPFKVRDIRIEGLVRIAPGTIFNYLPVKVGDTLNDNGVQDAIRALYRTGFFKDVKLEREGDVLVVKVTERASIDSVKITGTKELSEEDIRKSLKELGLAEGRVFDQALLDRIERELKTQYFSRGRYAVQVKTTVTPLERNRVAIRLDVSEGEVAKIARITIVGNKAFEEKLLLKQFSLGTSHLFSFFTKNDQYSKLRLSADLESLRNYYQNRGYLEFGIDSTQVSISPEKDEIYVTINVTEGDRFTVSGYEFAGKLAAPEADLRKLVTIKPGDVFSRQAVTDNAKAIGDRLGNDGYAFANVNPVPDIDRAKKTVKFTFFVDPGRRVYVRRIDFVGNTSTTDQVLRREMRQMEGAWYSTDKLQRSRIRLQRLGFFDDINFETLPVAGAPDQVDIRITVKERLVNNFQAGIGYSDTDGLLINASVTLKNLYGTGRELLFSVDNSSANRQFNLSFLDPYWTQSGVSRSFNFNVAHTDAAAAETAPYTMDTKGAGINFGIPISEERSIGLGLNYEFVTINTTATSALVATNFVTAYGNEHGVFRLNFSWARDSLDSALFPSRGTFQKLQLESTLPGGDLEYYRANYSASVYIPLTSSITWRLKGELSYGDGLGETPDLPFYKNYFAGGSSSVRGYRGRSLGPVDIGGPDPTLPIGGSQRVLANTEVYFPFPGSEDSRSMRLSVFVDGGMVYAANERVDLGTMRYSAGVAFNWFSPIGPMAISWAKPFNDESTDRTEAIQFSLGQSFR